MKIFIFLYGFVCDFSKYVCIFYKYVLINACFMKFYYDIL